MLRIKEELPPQKPKDQGGRDRRDPTANTRVPNWGFGRPRGAARTGVSVGGSTGVSAIFSGQRQSVPTVGIRQPVINATAKAPPRPDSVDVAIKRPPVVPVRQKTVLEPTPIPTQRPEDTKPMDLGQILVGLGSQYIESRWGQQPQPMGGYVGTPTASQPVFLDDGIGLGLPGVDVISEPPACGSKNMVYDPNKGKWIKRRTRRRRRLITPTDLNDLAALKTIVGGGQALTAATIRAVGR